jgi:hypothetical protein
MTRPGKALISLADTPYYHITSRCVPKALRGAGSTQSTSWGRLYAAPFFVAWIITLARTTSIDANGIVDHIRLLSSLFDIDLRINVSVKLG